MQDLTEPGSFCRAKNPRLRHLTLASLLGSGPNRKNAPRSGFDILAKTGVADRDCVEALEALQPSTDTATFFLRPAQRSSVSMTCAESHPWPERCRQNFEEKPHVLFPSGTT